MKPLPKLKVAADPRFIGGHPYHQSRFIITEGADLVAEPTNDGGSVFPEKGEVVTLADNHGSIIATLTDCENQADIARVMAAAPELLEVVSALVEAGGIMEPSEWFDKAQAAFAKAKGEA